MAHDTFQSFGAERLSWSHVMEKHLCSTFTMNGRFLFQHDNAAAIRILALHQGMEILRINTPITESRELLAHALD